MIFMTLGKNLVWHLNHCPVMILARGSKKFQCPLSPFLCLVTYILTGVFKGAFYTRRYPFYFLAFHPLTGVKVKKGRQDLFGLPCQIQKKSGAILNFPLDDANFLRQRNAAKFFAH